MNSFDQHAPTVERTATLFNGARTVFWLEAALAALSGTLYVLQRNGFIEFGSAAATTFLLAGSSSIALSPLIYTVLHRFARTEKRAEPLAIAGALVVMSLLLWLLHFAEPALCATAHLEGRPDRVVCVGTAFNLSDFLGWPLLVAALTYAVIIGIGFGFARLSGTRLEPPKWFWHQAILMGAPIAALGAMNVADSPKSHRIWILLAVVAITFPLLIHVLRRRQQLSKASRSKKPAQRIRGE
ncbi:hypothetical protein F1721_16380 [Saccharopolyspora hirsuta]|uniref:Uncharacterized protein n=1 Tax=Saccharopolyspora hirsuta TaxID=1837 RepID=A0A5M7BS32_SACHI|nr:hypothetical protein [Saccharopolyspora hirsuta]KAA5832579.1 hypothetical protein F1721_16380 [Saccharopolyspora hirsuta]